MTEQEWEQSLAQWEETADNPHSKQRGYKSQKDYETRMTAFEAEFLHDMPDEPEVSPWIQIYQISRVERLSSQEGENKDNS